MIIIKSLIINYINKLSKEDINNFAISKDIFLSNNELDYLYSIIKNNYNELLNNFDISKYKNYFSDINYIKINKLIDEYKNKYFR